MKRLFNKKRPDLFWSIVCLLAMMMSCSSEVEPAGIENSEPLTDNETLSEELCDFDTIPANETALEYFDLLKTVILADDANNSSTVTVIPDTPETAAEAAFEEKLADIKIIDENGLTIGFANLSRAEKEVFLNDWAKQEAIALTQKMETTADFETYVSAENQAMAEALQAASDAVEATPEDASEAEAYSRGNRKAGLYKSNRSRRNIPANFNSSIFFKEIAKRFNSDENSRTQKVKFRSSSSTSGPKLEKVDSMYFLTSLRRHAEPGNLLLRLPKHGNTSIKIKIEDFGKDLTAGHVAILGGFTKNGTENNNMMLPTFNGKIGIGAYEEGVRIEILSDWLCKSYILCIQRVNYYKIKTGWFSYKYIRTYNRFLGLPELYASAINYKGYPYCDLAEMPIAKWLAPQKFICTTLAWYCVKKLKDINITSWYSTMPTPSDILLNENIYIKFNIK